jgi:hypothetical protein
VDEVLVVAGAWVVEVDVVVGWAVDDVVVVVGFPVEVVVVVGGVVVVLVAVGPTRMGSLRAISFPSAGTSGSGLDSRSS